MAEATVPVIETERLRLRGRTLEDFPVFCALWADPDVTQFIGGKPLNEEETWSKFLRMIGHWSIMNYGYWAVEEKASGSVVGEVGFGDFKRAMSPSIKGQPEAGWVFATSAHGKGYATEAVLAAIQWGNDHFKGARMSCIIDPAHLASIRVAEKCGFVETSRGTYHDEEVVLLHRG